LIRVASRSAAPSATSTTARIAGRLRTTATMIAIATKQAPSSPIRDRPIESQSSHPVRWSTIQCSR
jgi:hypothetical protein